MARSYKRLRETTFDLYVERDTLPAYFRFITLLSTWILYVGYILFAISFSDEQKNLLAPTNLLVAVASALLIIGYLACAITAFFSRSLLFLVDNALWPLVSASFMGILITGLIYGLHRDHPIATVYMIVPLITSCATTIVSAVSLGMVYREIGKIKSRDERRRWHVAMGPYGTEQQLLAAHNQRVPGGVEDEASRRQLARLLHGRQEQTSMENLRGTYKIDLPGEQRGDPLAWETDDTARPSFHLSDLFPWKNSHSGTFKDAREKRREEIERSGFRPRNHFHQPQQHRSHTGSTSPHIRASVDPNLQEQHGSPAWGWPAATRYA